MVYKFKPGSRYGGDGFEPQPIGEYLERIRVKHGCLKPEVVVAHAKPEASPIHRVFEWDDEVAAEEYRLIQARALCRSVVVEVQSDEAAEPVRVRAFVSVTGDDNSRSYQAIQEVMQDDGMREELLATAWKELSAWRRKYQVLTELSTVFNAIDQTTPLLTEEARA
jgi:hypothetical protein